jgi:hypothetical protein
MLDVIGSLVGKAFALAGDVSLLLIFLAIALAIGFFFGRTKLLSIMIDVYIARVFVAVIPQGWIAAVSYGDAIIFGIVFVFLFIMDQRLFDIHLSNRGSDFFWRLVVMSILVTGMILSPALSYLPDSLVLSVISETTKSYFTAPLAAVFWMAMPLLMVIFINGKLRRY